MKGIIEALGGIVVSIIGFALFLLFTVGPWWFGSEIVSYGMRLWRERTPEPPACAQMLADAGRIRENLREGIELFRANAPREKLTPVVEREEALRLSFARAWLERESCYEGTLRAIAAENKKLEADQVEFAEVVAARARADGGSDAAPTSAPAAPMVHPTLRPAPPRLRERDPGLPPP